MSYNKNTINFSQIDALLIVLDDLKQPYSLFILGEVGAYGMNDDDRQSYPIRKLVCFESTGIKRTIVEQMRRSDDCDANDYIMSECFLGETYPGDENWQLETTDQ